MKDWDYYEGLDIPYYGLEEKRAYHDQLMKEIDDTPMTSQERLSARSKAMEQADARGEQENAPRLALLFRRQEEFWRDARAELGYADWLGEEGARLLEEKAQEGKVDEDYLDTEAAFEELRWLMNLVRCLRPHLKEEEK